MARLWFRLLHPLKARRYARGGVVRGKLSLTTLSGGEWVFPLTNDNLRRLVAAQMNGGSADNADAPSS